MNDDTPKVFRMPIPKTRHYMALGNGDWTYHALLALSKLKPEAEAARFETGQMGTKRTVSHLHCLGRRYGFQVCCRTIRDSSVLVWVKKPGMDKNILKLWEP